jgi:hypothetical protein
VNTVSSDVGFKRRHIAAIKVLDAVARGLSIPKFPEFFMSMYAVFYGLALAFFGQDALTAMNFHPSSLMSDITPRMFGAVVTVVGCRGLFGLYYRNQRARLFCAMAMAVIWGSLALHYLMSEPPIQTAAVVHAFHSIMEACIFLRVFADLDGYWTDKGK